MKDWFSTHFIEVMIAITVVGILAGIAIPRVMATQDRTRIAAAKADLNAFRLAFALHELECSSYKVGQVSSLAELKDKLKDPSGLAYMSLPDTTNFSFQSCTSSDSTFHLTVMAKDKNKTELVASPVGIY